jgi:hypothetical protein
MSSWPRVRREWAVVEGVLDGVAVGVVVVVPVAEVADPDPDQDGPKRRRPV